MEKRSGCETCAGGTFDLKDGKRYGLSICCDTTDCTKCNKQVLTEMKKHVNFSTAHDFDCHLDGNLVKFIHSGRTYLNGAKQPCNIGGANNNGAWEHWKALNVYYINKVGTRVNLGDIEIQGCCGHKDSNGKISCQACKNYLDHMMSTVWNGTMDFHKCYDYPAKGPVECLSGTTDHWEGITKITSCGTCAVGGFQLKDGKNYTQHVCCDSTDCTKCKATVLANMQKHVNFSRSYAIDCKADGNFVNFKHSKRTYLNGAMDPCNLGGKNNNGVSHDLSLKGINYLNKLGEKVLLGDMEFRSCCRSDLVSGKPDCLACKAEADHMIKVVYNGTMEFHKC